MQQVTIAETIARSLKYLSTEELRSIRELSLDMIFNRENAVTNQLKKSVEAAA